MTEENLSQDPQYRKLLDAYAKELNKLKDVSVGTKEWNDLMDRCDAAEKAVKDYEKKKGFKRE